MKKDEYRRYRPLVFYAKKQNKQIAFNTLEIYEIGKTKIEFTTPNIISIFINISNREYLNSIKSYKKLILPILENEETFTFQDEDLSDLYDYFESVKISTIFAYNSVEAFVNFSIPENYTYNKKNNKGVNEIWDKSSIQRWMNTSDKLINILPEIRNVDNPTNQIFWKKFKKLENLRNSIVHPKLISKERNVLNEIHKEFFDFNIFSYIRSIKDVMNYYCQGEYSEHYFPMGIGSMKIKPFEIEDFDEYFEEVV